MSWMSKHATEHKQNLLQDMPIDDKGSALLQSGEGDAGRKLKSVGTLGEYEFAQKLRKERRLPGFSEMPGDTQLQESAKERTSNPDFKKPKAEALTTSPFDKRFMGINPDHKGYCTPMTKATCTPRRKALAKRLKPGGDLYKGKKS
jgi:hypothetical protein